MKTEFEPTDIEKEELLVCVVRDKVAERTGPSFEVVNVPVAIRHFRHMLAKSQAPEDYELVMIGRRIGAKLIALDERVLLLDGKELLNEK